MYVAKFDGLLGALNLDGSENQQPNQPRPPRGPLEQQMTFWKKAARALRARLREVEDAESALSTEVLQLGEKLNRPPAGIICERLTMAADTAQDHELEKLLRWAAMHIQDQQEVIEAGNNEEAYLLAENKAMHASIKVIMQQADDLSAAAFDAMPKRDYVGTVDSSGYINIMGVHHKDPDYMTKGGLPTAHKDTKDAPVRKVRKQK